jgi:flagellar hook-basal body complex protein FliE
MIEQFNAVSNPALIGPLGKPAGGIPTSPPTDGKDFQSLLMDSINEVNRLQTEADQARIDLVTGRTENVAEVFTAVKKADLAFQTLMQIRNKLLEAYEEIKQMRV